MGLAPLLDAAPAIPVNAVAAMAAFGLGVVQPAAPKGTLPHRRLGWIWVGLMLSVAVSSFWIHQIRLVRWCSALEASGTRSFQAHSGAGEPALPNPVPGAVSRSQEGTRSAS